MMQLKEQMDIILQKRKELNINDDFGIEKCWKEMTRILSQNENETINYLEKCKQGDLYYISEIFEDISENLQSGKFINCLRELGKKFPELEMTHDIDMAESYIKK